MKYTRIFLPLLLILLTACQPAQKKLELARATENSVEVIVTLTRGADGQTYLSATFAPVEKNLHLYSKDIPLSGIEGVGRPALLELSGDSTVMVSGELQENVAAESPSAGPQELMIYPAGAVTLSLPILLPAGTGWFSDAVIVTYMACTDFTCRPPVEGKVIPIQLPQSEAFN